LYDWGKFPYSQKIIIEINRQMRVWRIYKKEQNEEKEGG